VDKIHIESLDVLKAQSDLLEQRDRVYKDMNQVIDILQASPCFPSLLWAWTFDIIRNKFENSQFDDLAETDIADEVIPSGVTLKQIFDKFWDDVDTLGLTMDDGGEILEECIFDWMRENDFLVALDDDGWLDD
jgi:hypothetical protein